MVAPKALVFLFRWTRVTKALGKRLLPLPNERRRGLAGMHRDKALVAWPLREGGDPAEGLVLGWLLWKPTL